MNKVAIWHAGEKAIQEKVGVAERMEQIGSRVVRDYMPDQHREFYAQVPFIVAGSVDARGDAWATLIAGKPGFMSSPNPRTLVLDVKPDPSDPASEGMHEGEAMGLLGIELHTRRRNRLNGILSASTRLRLDVDQSFGNCPQYIQLRDYELVGDPRAPYAREVERGSMLDADARAMISNADTFFVASYAEREERRQVDVSHRGGKAGFVRVGEDGTLTIPDFAGNLFFATLGNILLNGKAGLVFVDFQTGDLLQLTGDAAVILESPEIAAFQGAERLWRFRPRHVVRRRGALALRWSFQKDGWSPNSLMTGDWAQANDRMRAAELATKWRPFKVTKLVDESASVRSLHLLPDDGAGLIPHSAGQHLPIRVTLEGKSVLRMYTLSVAPSDGAYRISVKRDGLVSNYLHDEVRVGDVIEARAPAGAFTIDALEKRPAVLLAAGIGITPMLAMLRHVVYEGLRKRAVRPTVLFYSAHSIKERPFIDELSELETRAPVKVIRVLSNVEGAAEADYDAQGRIDVAMLSRFLSFDDYDFYLCGPAAFTQSLYDGLRERNIADERIHAEAFGPSSLVRTGAPKASQKPVPVVFTRSLKEARWESGTLLELAEARGLNPEFSCRTGTCGTCKTKLCAGTVTYLRTPGVPLEEDEVLICSAVPAPQDGTLELAL